MKKLNLITLCIILISSAIHSQWTNQNPVPDGNDLWSTFFVDDSTGWIVGSGGFIKKTTNAGNEWIAQNSGTTLILKSVQFVDQNTGWICGESGLILKTNDGGTSWDSLASSTTQHLSDIYFYDTNIGYVVGFNGTILKTTDSGSSWISLSSGTTNDLYSMDFVDAFVGYAAGEVNDTSSVIQTTDGGATWIDKSSGFPVTIGKCLAIEFIDASIGFIGCGHNLYKTTDGGDSWSQSKVSFALIQEELQNRELFGPYTLNEEIHSIFFKDAINGWYIDWQHVDNYICTTTDGGISWQSKRYYWERPLLSVFVTQNGTGLAVGSFGLIYLKAESDYDWSRLLSGTYDKTQSIYFVDRNIGWVGGTRYGNPNKGVILKTTNGGKQWKTQLEIQGVYDYSRCFYFLNESLGWLAKANNEAPTELLVGGLYRKPDVGGVLYRTTDGGETWININSAGDFSSVFFITQDTGWVTSDNSTSKGIYKSIDGGVTLEKKSSVSSSSIYFSDYYNGWSVGPGGILKSTDGGETWITKSNLTGSHIKFFDSNVGMCVGESILVSTDGGETWSSKNGLSLQSINFINSTTIWGYASEGTLYKTTNLGDTWEALNTGLGFGETAFFINEYTGWVGGMDGTMFKYSVEPPPPPTPPIWSNQINVEDAGSLESAQSLTFGQHIGATDSIDASLGEYEVPPPPPTGIFDARFNLPTNPQVSALSDYRDSAETEIMWTMTFQPGSSGYPMTFSWDSTSFPQGTFYLQDRINGSFVNVNMKNQRSYILTEPAITSLNISYRGNYSLVSVKNDWNMISVPLLAEDMTLNNVFPTATSLAYGYNGGYFSEDTLKGGVGYWLKFDGNQQIQIFGSRMGDTVPLVIGWNMFGVYENNIPVSQITTTPPGIIATNLFGFNDGYYIADTLQSGQGYWVRVTEDGVINLNTGGLPKGDEQKQFAETSKNWGKIKITDNKSRSITLFAATEEIESNSYELPPMPPTGIFDVRFSSGTVVENLSGEKIIQISSDDYPITIRAEGLSITVRDRINGKLLNEELKSGEEIRITNNKITSIGVSGRISAGLPASFELYQNYPNPFNPGTKIKFAVPRESNVNLSIYSVLGELVSTLVNQEMKPGYYEVEFSAEQTISLSSGIYFYRLQAGSFIETKKMILLR
ncbi:MAG: T9SS type A sorting domain-containing protein [Ignavibacteriaceae bacterium]|nr:T9SS type A sorting domain-containing protein [Ignavibacteriaceae bacterium]